MVHEIHPKSRRRLVSINTKTRPVSLSKTHWHMYIENLFSTNACFVLCFAHCCVPEYTKTFTKENGGKKEEKQLPGQLASFSYLSIPVFCASSRVARDMNRAHDQGFLRKENTKICFINFVHECVKLAYEIHVDLCFYFFSYLNIKKLT
jgi:hypothetical protein